LTKPGRKRAARQMISFHDSEDLALVATVKILRAKR
jgi:hypothetical protein